MDLPQSPSHADIYKDLDLEYTKTGWVMLLKENAEVNTHLSNWKKRWMSIDANGIGFSLKERKDLKSIIPHNVIQNVRALADYKGKQHVFKVGTKNRNFIIAVNSDDERTAWIGVVQGIMPKDWIRKVPLTSTSGIGVSMIGSALVSTFEKVKVIGTGGFSTVYLVRKQGTNKYYAMKVIKEGDMKTKNMEQEIRIMARINNPFLVKLHVSFKTQKYLYFVMDFINGGGLFYYLEKEDTLGETRSKFYAAEILCGLEYLHSRGIVYRDLKPENILLNQHGHVVLTDFGLSKTGLIGEGARTNTRCGTPYYVAPEIILGEEYTKAVDFWSLGVVLYEMLFGVPPFYSEDPMEIYKKIVMNDYTIDSSVVSEECENFIELLLAEDPSERLTDAAEIKKHEFFMDYNWEKLKRQEVTPPFLPKVSGPDDTQYFDADVLSYPIEHDDTQVSEYSDWTIPMQPEHPENLNILPEKAQKTPQKSPIHNPHPNSGHQLKEHFLKRLQIETASSSENNAASSELEKEASEDLGLRLLKQKF